MSDAQQTPRQYALQRIYLKDVSFESPRTPHIFRNPEWQPNINVQVENASNQLGEGVYEVALKITATASIDVNGAHHMEAVVQPGRFEPQLAAIDYRPIISVQITTEEGPPDRGVPGVGIGRPCARVPAPNGDPLLQFERSPTVSPQDEAPPIRQVRSISHADFASVIRDSQRILKRVKCICPA